MNVKTLINNVKDYIDLKKPINPFGYSIFEHEFDQRTSNLDMFTDMVECFTKDNTPLLSNKHFFKAISLLNSLRNLYYFEEILSDTVFGKMINIEDIDPTVERNYSVIKALQHIQNALQKVIYSPDYEHLDNIHTWRIYGFELLYTNDHSHCVLVIPYTGSSGYRCITRMIIPGSYKGDLL